ncbi:MAG: DMT family transporter [Desulfobacterium sp.]|nr:DMT family transporter [Desulfobacterium sp.]
MDIKERHLSFNKKISNPNRPQADGLPPGAAIYTAFICMLFGGNAVAIKISLLGLGIFTTASLRFALASVTVLFWARFTGKPLALGAGQLVKLIPVAVLFFFQLTFFYIGQSKTTASHGTLIINALPFVIMVLAHFFIPGETITWNKTAGMLLGFSGVLFLFSDQITMNGDALQGDLIILMAVLVWGCNAVYTKKIIPDFHPVQISLYPMMMATPGLFICALLFDGEMVKFVNTGILTAMFYQTFVTASFGFVVWNTMIRKYGATVLHSFVFIMPVSGVFFGVLLLKEPITPNLIISIILVTTGLIVVNKNGKKTIK